MGRNIIGGTDNCRDLCLSSAVAIGGCINDWGVDWTVLGANSQSDFRIQCQTEWDDVRTGLEPRQVESADERCADAQVELSNLSCDDLRALYL